MAPTGGVGRLLSTSPAPGWNVVATGDFNGDGITDVMWKNASLGIASEWLMSPNGGVAAFPGTPALSLSHAANDLIV